MKRQFLLLAVIFILGGPIKVQAQDGLLDDWAELETYQIYVSQSRSYEIADGMDYYVVDSEQRALLVIFDFGQETESYAYYYPDSRLVDMGYYYGEDFDVVNTFDTALEDFYDKLGTLEEIMAGRYVLIEEPYSDALFENYFVKLLPYIDGAESMSRDGIERLIFEVDEALIEAYQPFSPFAAEDLRDFGLMLEVNQAEQTVHAYERYQTDDDEIMIKREFSEAIEPVPLRGEVSYVWQEDFDEVVLKLGLPLY
ncbi:hypothetical protein ACTQ54_07125 [Fundicoccus sp. Sow4_H7]|uniref:hypothetical protein n=1 Tax=Fundicoccus sp. Sow4_H7 TaxID=3438784 RepID=UPI003F8E166D